MIRRVEKFPVAEWEARPRREGDGVPQAKCLDAAPRKSEGCCADILRQEEQMESSRAIAKIPWTKVFRWLAATLFLSLIHI